MLVGAWANYSVLKKNCYIRDSSDKWGLIIWRIQYERPCTLSMIYLRWPTWLWVWHPVRLSTKTPRYQNYLQRKRIKPTKMPLGGFEPQTLGATTVMKTTIPCIWHYIGLAETLILALFWFGFQTWWDWLDLTTFTL